MDSDGTGSVANEPLAFDPVAYLKVRFDTVDRLYARVEFPLKMFHEVYSSLPVSLKILSYGAGPSIADVISSASHASEIILSDYIPENREALRKWLKNKEGAFGWSHFFDYVVQRLEGRGEDEARKREKQLRTVISNIVRCNINMNPIIEEGFEGPYDVISTSCCLTCSCETREAFRVNVAKLAALLKHGGLIIMFEEERDMKEEYGVYNVGGIEHPVVNVSAIFVADILRDLGFQDIGINREVCKEGAIPEFLDSHHMGFMFITGVKK